MHPPPPAARLLLAAVAAAAPTGAAAAQDEPPRLDAPFVERMLPEAQSRLRSEQAASVAWGAFLAGRFGLRDAVPDLEAALARRTEQGPEWDLVRLHLLDALVELDGGLGDGPPAAALRGIALPPALVLMARESGAHLTQLFALFVEHGRRQGDPRIWRATGNLLAAAKAPGLAAWLLQRTPIELRLKVRNRGQSHASGAGGAAGGVFGDGRLSVPAAFPPTPVYELTEHGRTGDVLLADGPTPVHYRRRVRRERTLGIGRSREDLAAAAEHLRWLAVLAERAPGHLLLRSTHEVSIEFSDGEAFLWDVAEARRSVEFAHRALCSRLVSVGALPRDERHAYELDLTVRVRDLRVDRSQPLPEIPR